MFHRGLFGMREPYYTENSLKQEGCSCRLLERIFHTRLFELSTEGSVSQFTYLVAYFWREYSTEGSLLERTFQRGLFPTKYMLIRMFLERTYSLQRLFPTKHSIQGSFRQYKYLFACFWENTFFTQALSDNTQQKRAWKHYFFLERKFHRGLFPTIHNTKELQKHSM